MKYYASEAMIRAAKIAGLGRVTDAEVAKILGVSRQRPSGPRAGWPEIPRDPYMDDRKSTR